jgi:hypothetical protein
MNTIIIIDFDDTLVNVSQTYHMLNKFKKKQNQNLNM